MRQLIRLCVVKRFMTHDDAHFSAGLNGIRGQHPVERSGDVFELFESLDVALNRFTPGSRSCAADGIGSLDECRNGSLHWNVIMMRANRIANHSVFVEFLAEIV